MIVAPKFCISIVFSFSWGPRETENNAYAKFCGYKQRTLWYVMVFLEWSIAEILISTHLMLFHSMKQSQIISWTGYSQVYSLTQIYPSLLSHWVSWILRFNYFYDNKHVSDKSALNLPEREFEGLFQNSSTTFKL